MRNNSVISYNIRPGADYNLLMRQLIANLVLPARGFCLCVVLLSGQSLSAFADDAKNIDDLAEQIRQTNEQLDALKQQIDSNNMLKSELQSAFDMAREKRGERDQRLSELDTRIEQFNAQLRKLESAVTEADAAVNERKRQLAEALRGSQSIAASSTLQTLLHQDDPAQAQRLAVFREYLFKAQRQQIDIATRYLRGVDEARLKALQDRNWLNHIRDKATTQRDSYDRDAQAKRLQIDDVDVVLQQTTRTVAQLRDDQARLQSLMDELESMQRGGSGYFAALQGEYQLPVNGDIRAHFGDEKSVGKLRWEGLFIAAKSGRTVRALADGAVVYSDWLQGFGMLVILDHGDGYMTLYGGNRTVNVENGTWVESGATIATVGDSGGQNTSGLYFEIRHNASALDPEEWLNPASS